MKYYFDTSIWIDIFEDRKEPDLDKGLIARRLINKIRNFNDKIIHSKLIYSELINSGYSFFEIKKLFHQFKDILIYVYPTDREIGKSRDIANKRGIPKGDALRAILSRNHNSILVSRDNNFKKITDIAIARKPEELI